MTRGDSMFQRLSNACMGTLAVVLVTGVSPGASRALTAQQAAAAPQCAPSAELVTIAELREASGVAASRRTPGRLWAHNDSGEPVLFALDTSGAVAGRVRVEGAAVEDWEAVAVGPCPAGSCLYIGDVGDNDADRERITIYRLAEPSGATGSTQVTDVFHGAYPDGAHDAEALLIAPDGRVHIVTKGETGPVALYRFPAGARPGTTLRLEPVGRPRESGGQRRGERITDGAVSPDGEWVALRGSHALMFFRAADFFAGRWREAGRVSLDSLGEPQGEGVAFGADRAIYVMGEGGGRSRAGTFARLTCSSK
jgi:hypothetical protein